MTKMQSPRDTVSLPETNDVSITFATLQARRYLSPARPTMKSTYVEYQSALCVENKHRMSAGLPHMRQVGRTTFEKLIKLLPKIDVLAARYGFEVGSGLLEAPSVSSIVPADIVTDSGPHFHSEPLAGMLKKLRRQR